jgi:YVTN family beta-propeller protein
VKTINPQTHAVRVHLAALLFALAAPVSATTSLIYVTNSAGDNIHVIDAATNKVVQVIKGIESSHGVAFSPDGTRVYISDESLHTLDVVERKSARILKRIALSGRPNNIAVTHDGARVVVCIAEDDGGLDFIDTKAMTLAKTLPLKGRMHNVYVTPDGKFAVSGSVRHNFMSVVDLATDKEAWRLDLGTGVRPMTFETAADGSTRRVFAQLSGLSGFSVIDFVARKELQRIKFPDQPGGYGVIERRAPGTPSHGIGVAPDGKTLWVNSHVANAVFVYALPDLKPLGHVALPDLRLPGRDPIGAIPDWLTFTPDGKRIYVGNSALKSVAAIDTGTMKVLQSIAVGEVPKRMATLVLRD